jgi:hypothetical protein
LESLVIIAAAIPFAIFAVVFTLLATVRYTLTDTHMKVSVLSIPLRSVQLSDITSVEHIEQTSYGLPKILSVGDTVILRHGPDNAAFTVMTREPELMAEMIRARVKELTGRDV